jgi:hypothetical protein
MANRFRRHGKAYFEFITTPGLDPTHNVAEQAIRLVVIDRLVTQGTRSLNGGAATKPQSKEAMTTGDLICFN